MRTEDYGMCFGCGKDNPIGLKLSFTREGDVLYSVFTPRPEFQGYPGVLHGGILTALLDEVMANDHYLEGRRVVTAELSVRFKKPVPLGQPLKICSRRKGGRHGVFLLEGWVEGPDGEIYATAEAKMMESKDMGRAST